MAKAREGAGGGTNAANVASGGTWSISAAGKRTIVDGLPFSCLYRVHNDSDADNLIIHGPMIGPERKVSIGKQASIDVCLYAGHALQVEVTEGTAHGRYEFLGIIGIASGP